MSENNDSAALAQAPQVPSGVEEAIRVAKSGLPVFPLVPNGPPFLNADIAAARGIPEPPQGDGGFKFASIDEAEIRAMWSGRPVAEIGIRTGAASGLYVLDLDRKNGKDGFAVMEGQGWQPTATYWMNTRNGGRHHYYSIPRDGSRNYPSDGNLGAGIDRKGDGGFVRWYGFAFGGEQLPTVQPPEWMLAGGGHGRQDREPLGTLPTVDVAIVEAALDEIDPDELNYDAWRNLTAAYRGAGGGSDAWDRWRARYAANNLADNDKLWRSFECGTALGWDYLKRHAPEAAARVAFGDGPATGTTAPQFGEFLTAKEQREYFHGCTLIGPRGVIVDGKGVEYRPGQFNAQFGGKRFIISSDGKATDEAWKAATRSTLWTVPKVNGYAFRTDLPTGSVASDELGRTAVNVYVPARIDRMEGDPAMFLDHLARIIPDDSDRRILLEYLAHNVRFPGFKIPWAPLIQSTEGVGKNVLKHVMTHAIGNHYTYAPNAKELGSSGSKFNAWMERKLLLIADEIKTDDKRDLVEILKPMISEETLEIQGKGVDQRKADNPANWLFFSNHKDAIPIGTNDRRFAIFYSAVQSRADLDAAGMSDAYFARLYDDFLGNRTHRRGLMIVADYLLRYPIERGAIPMRAPVTTSTIEAVEAGRSWLEQLIAEAVESKANGFRAGWINTAAVGRVLRENGSKARPVSIGAAISALGYYKIGQAGRGWFADDPSAPNKRGILYNVGRVADPLDYGSAQEYGN